MQEHTRTMHYLCTPNTLKGLLKQTEFLFLGIPFEIGTTLEGYKKSKGGNIKYLYHHFVPIKTGICTADVW